MTTALIAEDEPLLAQALRAELARAWPQLQLLETAVDGDDAVDRALAQRPDIVFLDIRMPGRNGLDAAAAIVEDWPDAGQRLPLIVFVTAYDQYALQAFERAAVDYLQKPVQPARLAACCARLQEAIALRAAAAGTADAGTPAPGAGSAGASTRRTDLGADDAALIASLRALLAAPAQAPASAARSTSAPPGSGAFNPATTTPPPPPDPQASLTILQASIGSTLHMIPVAEVIYIEAADKYLRVVTAEREALIRMSLRELLPRLDAALFWQIHRGTVVRADAIATATRDDSGKVFLTLRARPERLVASRLYASLFRGM